MENHPIPQDITGFQFKLIGSMTVKQFLYLAAGVIIGWFVFSSGLFFLIKWPLVILFGGGGAALAFIPIEGRPMDVMITNFIKAFFRETTYVYDKTGGNINQITKNTTPPVLTADPVSTQTASPQVHQPSVKLEQDVPSAHHYDPAANQAPVLQMSSPLTAQVVTTTPAIETPVAHEIQETNKTFQKIQSSQEKIQEKRGEAFQNLKQPNTLADMQPKPGDAPLSQPVSTVTPSAVRQVPASQTKSVGIPLAPEAPNLVTGIIKDPRGNPLPNILVEIKDKDGNPVRAFKTNGLGHFASATPLLDGSYTVEFEDIKAENKFQKISFEAKGQVIMPFEIISTDKREELRKELFQN